MSDRRQADSELGPVVELRGVRKSFGGVHALKGVDLVVPSGTVIGLAGENGAGKSTLLKVLSGIYQPDAGEVLYDGIRQTNLMPATARAAGIAAVAQELSLFEHLPVGENILIGQEPMRGPFVNAAKRDRMAADALVEVGSTVSVHDMVRDLEFAERQLVEIAKALVSQPRVLILDEPTSGLRESEVDRLLELIRRLRERGTSVVFITHRLSEMFAVCDTFTVLKDGESVASRAASDIDADTLVSLMVGRKLEALFPSKDVHYSGPTDVPLLSAREFSVIGTRVKDISLDLRPGEIVGIAGLAGNGQNDLLEGLAGIRASKGELRVGSAAGPFRNPRKALRAGVSLVPEDRKRHGLVLAFSIFKNLTLPTLPAFSRAGVLSSRKEQAAATTSITAMAIRPPDGSLIAGGLSGGNQQKIVIGRTLLADPSVYLFADPTRGIDVGTKYEIYVLMRRLAAEGKGIVLMSTDLSETIGVCDRVLVISGGRIVAELAGERLTEEEVTKASFEAGTEAA
ncbi:sugar ABC transporter ATP-binding protein [Compostimonas suwonensis]|uniref:Ribose transport system ATP-binding protein/rhamnose transport system ATP-binding protein/putative xylitol transport system ATP-binding protein n=1 Tax=Compostimonas suwonensis TaxID=1048394 RepID=A0A2M9BYT1_9MICO|nr:sugar ABC transporter ATP-binding protein [Compostimonas suwonensis]PJJ63237.1 ribose transport system ATP-binding protein/rhamnose transport system ATP-binding protein/putative xylitol transport system ATP-binding protein [Compostimonas suwonensis]